MNPKQGGGYLFLCVSIISICFQLPQDIDTDLTFGFYGSETSLTLPQCNAIAPKNSNCKELSSFCENTPYISGPQSAAAGGENTLRFDPTGNSVICTTNNNYKSICPNKPIWSQTDVICTPVMVLEE